MIDDTVPFRLHHGAEAPAPVRMYELLYSSLVSQLIIAVAEVGVADAFGTQPRHIDDLARDTGTRPGALYRVLRALATVGVFSEITPRTFVLTPLGATLRSDPEGSMRDLARYAGLPERQRAFGALAHSLRTGEPSFDHLHGADWWTHFAERPQLSSLFNAAMGTMARMVNGATLESIDLSGTRLLVDVGGGKGRLVATLLAQYPELQAVVYDLPHVAAEAERTLRDAGVADRGSCVGGDFLDHVPADGDVYVLSWTIHDWNDEDATRILRNIREVMRPGARLLIIDEVLPEGDAPHFGKFEDIVMLALLKGHVRTEAEFRVLLAAAGLAHKETRPTAAPTSVVVAVPA